MSLPSQQIDKALSLRDFDCWYDSAGEFFVHIAHSDEGVYLLIVDTDCKTVYSDMSFYCSYLWMAVMNAREWPRTLKANYRYIIQRKLEKAGDKYRVYERSPKNKDGFKKDVRSFSGFLSIPIQDVEAGTIWRHKKEAWRADVMSVSGKYVHYKSSHSAHRCSKTEFKREWEIIRQ